MFTLTLQHQMLYSYYNFNRNTPHFFITDAVAVTQAQFGPGTGPTVYSNVRCTGNETAITNCSYTPGGACSDAGVICQRRRCKYSRNLTFTGMIK